MEVCINGQISTIELAHSPSEEDFMWVKECAIGTMLGKEAKTKPDSAWTHRILEARHSPIRELWYKFVLRDIPYWLSVHLVRHHVGVNCYVQSQRNDRQSKYDRNSARQDAPVTMRMSLNAEALMTLANKRLCYQASSETRIVVEEMCRLAIEATPELEGLLIPMCEYHGNTCHEMKPCGRFEPKELKSSENLNERIE